MKSDRATVLIIQPGPFAHRYRKQIFKSATSAGYATICGIAPAAHDGTLIGYGPDLMEMYHGAGQYAARIVKGEKPADLPVQQPTHFQLAIKQNVSKLVPVWAYSLADLQGGESFPLVKDGVIYVTTHDSTAAVDAITGKQIWRVKHEYPPETLRVVCCGIVNRGAAIYEGMIIRALMDDRLTALDAKSGKEIWTVKSPEPVTHANGYAMTGAPLIVNGVVIMGVAGAEFSHRGPFGRL